MQCYFWRKTYIKYNQLLSTSVLYDDCSAILQCSTIPINTRLECNGSLSSPPNRLKTPRSSQRYLHIDEHTPCTRAHGKLQFYLVLRTTSEDSRGSLYGSSSIRPSRCVRVAVPCIPASKSTLKCVPSTDIMN